MWKRALAWLLAFSILLIAPALADAAVPSRLAEDGSVRVLLRSLSQRAALHLSFDGIYAASDGLLSFDRGTQATLSIVDGGVVLASGGVRLSLGPSVTFKRYKAAEGNENGLRILENASGGLYLGDLTVSAEGEALRAVLTLDVEDYLLGVVGYEMSDSWPLEALKAQAVAARTYVLQRKAQAGDRDYDVVDTTGDQVYRGAQAAFQNVQAAVEGTRGIVGTWQGAYATCYYTASNGGEVALPSDVWELEGDFGYIERKEDPYDLENPLCTVKSVTFRADLSDAPVLKALLEEAVDEALEGAFTLESVQWITPIQPVPADSKRYTKLQFDVRCLVERTLQTPAPLEGQTGFPAVPFSESAGKQEQIVSVTLDVFGQLKPQLDLAINTGDYELIQVSPGAGTFTLETRRFGHGVGLSQRGAQRMAGVEGMTGLDILRFYYPGMQLERLELPETPLEELAGSADAAPTPAPAPAELPELLDGEYYAHVVLHGDADALNIRQAPSTGSAVLDRFEEGRRLIVTSREDANGWVQIRTAELSGYAKAYYLEAE